MDISGPEQIISVSKSTVNFVTTSGHRLMTSPTHVVEMLVDSPRPSDHEWAPPFDLVSEILHQMPADMTRLSIRFEKVV